MREDASGARGSWSDPTQAFLLDSASDLMQAVSPVHHVSQETFFVP